MDHKDTASFLGSQLAQIYASRETLALQTSVALTQKYTALEPVLRVMKKYNIPFRNPFIAGECDKGAIIGETDGILHVFDGIDVRYVDAETGEYIDIHDGRSPYGHTIFEDYLNTCNLDYVQAGIEYIENLTTESVDAEKQRNRDIVKLLDYLQS